MTFYEDVCVRKIYYTPEIIYDVTYCYTISVAVKAYFYEINCCSPSPGRNCIYILYSYIGIQDVQNFMRQKNVSESTEKLALDYDTLLIFFAF